MKINNVMLGVLIGSILYGVNVIKMTYNRCAYNLREEEERMFLESEVRLIELEKTNLRISEQLGDLSERIILILE